MNQYMDNHRCYFHPRDKVIGICALCLNERLLVLASQQKQHDHHHHQSSNNSTHRTHGFAHTKNPINLPKIFALSSLLNRLDLRQRKSADDQYSAGSGSPEDSFISIKFGDNGAASWEKNTVLPKVSLENCDMSLKQRLNKEVVDDQRVKAVIEHPKPHGSSLRWGKRIGHIFQLMRWKKCNKGNVCHVGTKLDGVKVRHGWIRSLTKRRTKE